MTVENIRLLAVIPARGGSKRLVGKNVLELSGKPLIAWTIQAALNSKFIDRVVVSTDDIKIANISKQYGADIPFIRPDFLSTDTATSMDTLLHTVNILNDLGDCYDYLILLQPTSPLRTEEHIEAAIDLLIEKNANSIVSVCEVDHPSEWINTIPSDLSMDNFINNEQRSKRSQDFQKEYRINGAIYLSKISVLIDKLTFFTKDSYAYIMDKESSIDIDDEYDYRLCEFYMERNNL